MLNSILLLTFVAAAAPKSPAVPAAKAKAVKPPSGVADVDAVLATYRRAPAVEARVQKTILQNVMGTKSESTGRFYFSKGKLRLDFDKPERSTLVYDGRTVWLESRLDDQHVQVSRVKAGSLRKSNSLMAALFDRRDALKAFRLVKKTEDKARRTFELEPRDPKRTEVRHLTITLEGANVRVIGYRDEMENQVDFNLSEVRLGVVPAAKFKYQPPRGATVTNL